MNLRDEIKDESSRDEFAGLAVGAVNVLSEDIVQTGLEGNLEGFVETWRKENSSHGLR